MLDRNHSVATAAQLAASADERGRTDPAARADWSDRADRAGGATPDCQACPLCGNDHHELIETLSYESIRYVYRRLLGIEIAAGPCDRLRYLRCLGCDLRFFSPQVCGDPGFYEKLQAFPWYYLEEKSEYPMASRLIPAGSSVLEVGCGTGVFSSFLPAGCRYRGLEYNGEAIRKARLRGLSVERRSIEELSESVQCATSAELGKPANSSEPADSAGSAELQFDVVCGFQVLEHLASPSGFLTGAARLLRRGGLLIVAVPSEESFMAEEVNNVLNTPPHHLTRWTDTALEHVARITGMPLVHLEHERTSDLHLRPLANARVWQVARRTLGMRVPMVSPVAASLWARVLLRLLSMPIEKRARKCGQRPIGHSVLAAYEKV